MKTHSQVFVNLVNEARGRVNECTVSDVLERLAAEADLVVIDVREESEWARGHVQGAVHLGKGVIERDIEKVFSDKSQDLILYCGGGYRSVLAADALRQMGYSRVVSMDGGYKGWLRAGGPTDLPASNA
jgi:rhodanese-related sulfurtransferase